MSLAKRGRRWAGATILVAVAGGAIALPAVSRANRASTPTTPAVADAHLFSGDHEMELAVTWARPDCGAMERGQVCLRYAVIRDDRPVEVGYGPIPASDLNVGSRQVSLKVNTDSVSSPSFHRVNGSGGAIDVVWNRMSVAPSVQAGSRISLLWTCSVQGKVAGYPLTGNGAHATILVSSS